MKTLTRYVLFELIKVFALALACMTLFMIVVGVLKEAYLQGLGLNHVVLLIPYIVPEALRFAVPGTILFAACSVYGRLAADNEVVAVKSMGISPMVLLRPLLFLSALLSFCTVGLNELAVTWGHDGMRRVIVESVEEVIYAKLTQQKSFATKDFAVNVSAVDGRRLIRPVFTFQSHLQHEPVFTVTAETAELKADSAADTFTVKFHDAEYECGQFRGSAPYFEQELPLSEATRKGDNRASPAYVPMKEILADVERQMQNIGRFNAEMAAEAGFQMITGDFLALNAHAWQPLTARVREAENRIARLNMEPHRRWAAGFSCLCFVIVGAPLAVLRRQSDYLSVFFLCFGPILVVYYPLFVFSLERAKSGGLPGFSVWLGNAAMVVCGCWLMRRVMKH
jgi:lipopolysaccharide export system permease protein